jgi:hypothetical protein
MKSEQLANSRRILEKVTYTPLILPNAHGGGAIEMLTAIAALGLVPGEIDTIPLNRDDSEQLRNILNNFAAFANAATPDERLLAAARLSQQSSEALAEGVNAVQDARSKAVADAAGMLKVINAGYVATHPAQASAEGPTVSARLSMLEKTVSSLELRTSLMSASGIDQLAHQSVVTAAHTNAQYPPVPVAPEFTTLLGAEIARTIGAAIQCAPTDDREKFDNLVSRLSRFVPEIIRVDPAMVILAGIPFIMNQLKKSASVTAQLARRNLQPAGLLHLEQLVITPTAVERGELIYTLPIAPEEKVTLSHKEWSLQEEEYSRFVQDHFENYSEVGVAETTDMAMSSTSQTEHSKTLSMGKPLVPGDATMADPVNGSSVEVTREMQSQDQSRRETQQITQRASSLAVKDQKISFTVTTVSGTQDFTSRVYKNTHKDKVMHVDYYRRMRRWHNELYRTGIRLTYDVVLPDPGRRLRAMWSELDDLETQIAAPFVFEYTPATPSTTAVTSFVGALRAGTSRFKSTISAGYGSFDFESGSVIDLDRLARSYGTTIPEAPDKVHAVEQVYAIAGSDTSNGVFEKAVTVSIPPDYKPVKAMMGGKIATAGGDVWVEGEFWDQSQTLVLPADGKFHSRIISLPENFPEQLTVSFLASKGAVGDIRVWADIEPTPEAWRKWRATVWTSIRQAAYTRYIEKRDRLIERRTALLRLLNAPDTLSLRRMEREQVMYLVLQWLYPDFAEGSQTYADAASGKASAWEPALEYGEYIKFVHQSIDWENALVILYPYFWDNPENHASKLYLNHPDHVHREFLRAGAVRIVLAIQPGYEDEVVSLLDKGHLGKLTPDSRFEAIIAKVHEEQKRLSELTQLEPPKLDNVQDMNNLPRFGESIGSWINWTPTSALDMDVRLRAVVEE